MSDVSSTVSIKDTPKDGKWYEIPAPSGEHYVMWEAAKNSWRSLNITPGGVQHGEYLEDGTDIITSC